MNFTTTINLSKQECGYTHKTRFFLVGSCFTENIGNKLLRYGFRTDINPFGILYNPVSIVNNLDFVIENKRITEADLFCYNELWHSYYHHSVFSHKEKEICLTDCNERIERSHNFLKNSDVIILTFGTAWAYNLKERNLIVGNCHKLPKDQFERSLLSVPDIVELYVSCIRKLKELNPSIKIILTVSPVRHWREGFRQNQISKSVLHLAIHELQEIFKDIAYFPAYEIMMDELRDYRFYDIDFLHPNTLSVNYIWEVFSTAFFSKEALASIGQIEKLRRMIEHRPFRPETKSWEQHVLKTKQFIEHLKNAYPHVDYDNISCPE